MIRWTQRRLRPWDGLFHMGGCLLAAGVLLLACSGGGGGGGSTTGGGTGAEQVAFSGRATLADDAGGSLSEPTAQSGVSVTVSSDIDANGSIDSTERAGGTTDSDGNFTITAPVEVGTRATRSPVRFTSPTTLPSAERTSTPSTKASK